MGSVGNAWKSTGWYHDPSSSTDVLSAIARIGSHATNQRFAWRGHADARWLWESSLQRRLSIKNSNVTEADMRSAEEKIIFEARDRGLGTSSGHEVDDLQLLTNLQHYGVPTRLIDVTSNPMTALWFATASSKISETSRQNTGGLLIAMNMTWYREATNDATNRPVTVFKTASQKGATLSAQLEDALKLTSPFVVSSSMPNSRLRAQEGYFLASALPTQTVKPLIGMQTEQWRDGTDITRQLFESIPRKRGYPHNIPFIAIYIRPNLKTNLREYLKNSYNKTSKSLFPDYSGMAHYGKWKDI